jgi:Tol biopolymer transport system component
MTFSAPALHSILLALQAATFHHARWSPDGRSVLIATHSESLNYLYELSTRRLRSLTVSEVREFEKNWAPPPSRRPRLIERSSASGQDVFIEIRGEAGWRKLNQERWAEQPSLSPRGNLVVYEAREDPNAILSSFLVLVDTSAGQPRRLTQGTDPSWSPDGSKILFKTPRQGELHVATIDVRSGAPRILTPGVHPVWSPDGSRIAYMVERAGRSDIWVMRVDGSDQQCLTCGHR